MAILDTKHALISLPNDPNRYQLGEIAGHNVAIACLNEAGTNEAASVAGQLKSSFKNVRFGLMVGIGGTVPSSDNDIRLGDIVVGTPTGDYGGDVQYDRGNKGQVEG
jgi:nucleoside phosphorylase